MYIKILSTLSALAVWRCGILITRMNPGMKTARI